jgi:hypothetical protein
LAEGLPALAGFDAGVVGVETPGVDALFEFAVALRQRAAQPVNMRFRDLVKPVVGAAAFAGLGQADEEGGEVGPARAFFRSGVSGSRGG